MSIDPYFGVEFASIDVDGYQERSNAPEANGAGWAIVAPDVDSDITTANLGLRLNWSVSGSRGVWLPQVDIAYVRVLDQDEDNTPLTFAGDLSPLQQLALQQFALINDSEDDDYFRLGLGLVAQWAQGRSGFVNLSRSFSDDRYSQTEITLGFRLEY
jgi:outer membrane autotransporter protein